MRSKAHTRLTMLALLSNSFNINHLHSRTHQQNHCRFNPSNNRSKHLDTPLGCKKSRPDVGEASRTAGDGEAQKRSVNPPTMRFGGRTTSSSS